MAMRFLIVEDNVQLAEIIVEALSDRSCVVDVAGDGEAAWHCIESLEYDLIVLDLTLPKLDGISFCQRLRNRNSSLPVLMLTARDTINDEIIGLDMGADDYMVKPFDLQELIARIWTLLSQAGATVVGYLSWGNLRLNLKTGEVTYSEHFLSLVPAEYALLEVLVSSGRRVLSRSALISRIWSLPNSLTEETVKSHIKSLQMKLSAVGAPEDLIEIVHGLGYRLKQLT